MRSQLNLKCKTNWVTSLLKLLKWKFHFPRKNQSTHRTSCWSAHQHYHLLQSFLSIHHTVLHESQLSSTQETTSAYTCKLFFSLSDIHTQTERQKDRERQRQRQRQRVIYLVPSSHVIIFAKIFSSMMIFFQPYCLKLQTICTCSNVHYDSTFLLIPLHGFICYY